MAMSIPIASPKVQVVPITNVPQNTPDSLKLISLKDPDQLEPADTYPTIVWGNYTYWPLSYSDNRYAICLVAYDSNEVVSKLELKGARYVVTMAVDDLRKQITVVGQSSLTVTVSWNDIGMFSPIHPQYFWVINGASETALHGGNGSVSLTSLSAPVKDAQLWLLDAGRQAIFPKAQSPGLTLGFKDGSLCLLQTNWGDAVQRWIIDPSTGHLIAVESGLVATAGFDSLVTLQSAEESNPANQRWFLRPYIPVPDLTTNQLTRILPGEAFKLFNEGHVLSASGGSGAPLKLVANSAESSQTTWLFEGGAVVNAQNGLAITKSGSSVIGGPLTGGAEQQLILTDDGLFAWDSNLLMSGHGTTVSLSAYDALRPPSEQWLLQLQQAEAAPSHLLEKRDVVGSAATQDNITKLTVTAKVSNDLWAGTNDTILIGFETTSGPVQTLFKAPTRGESVTLTIDLQSMFGKSAITLGDVSYVYLRQVPEVHPIASDAWKLESIILKANDLYTNYTFQKIDKWLDNPTSYPLPAVWSGIIPWGAWLDKDQKPVDLNGSTYPVGWLPWIGDLKSWRSYDPSTIDGVGQLLGVKDGRIIGEQLKARKTEILQQTDDSHSYTWVFTPDGAVIYRLWDKNDRDNYIRHSQLGSGDPVICAGEMLLNVKILTNYTVGDVIAMVNDASGHYKPDGGSCLRYVGEKLQELGVPTDTIEWWWR